MEYNPMTGSGDDTMDLCVDALLRPKLDLFDGRDIEALR